MPSNQLRGAVYVAASDVREVYVPKEGARGEQPMVDNRIGLERII